MPYTSLRVLLFLLAVGHQTVTGFFVNTTLPDPSPRNVSCRLFEDLITLAPVQQAAYGFNLTYNFSLVGNEFCSVQYLSIMQPNGTVINTTISSLSWGINYNQRFQRRRCSSGTFTSSTPVGYSACTRLPHERFTTTMCICSANFCNENYATCVASVQSSQSPRPPNIGFDVPELTNLISCSQGYQGATYQDIYQATGFGFNALTPLNLSQARAYAGTNAVACLIYVYPSTGDRYQLALAYEDYPGYLYQILEYRRANILGNFSEGPTNVLAQFPVVYSSSAFFAMNTASGNHIMCFCTTNNCNQNLSTCSTGLTVGASSSTSLPSSSTISTTVRTTNASQVSPTTTGAGGTSTARATTAATALRGNASAAITTLGVVNCLALLLFLLAMSCD